MVFIFYHPPNYPLATFLVQIFITLCLTRFCGKLVSYVKQPRVIGEIIGGILLGPTALGRIPGFTKNIFPQYVIGKTTDDDIKLMSYSTFSVAAQLGLIFFMFLMGLELNMAEVKKVWKKTVPISLATIIFPFALGTACSPWWREINDEGNDASWESPDAISFILFAGTSMSFTAFPVLCSMLKTAREITTPLGTIAVSSAAVDDVLAWSMLAIASSFAQHGNATEGAATFGIAVLYALIMIFGVRRILAWIYEHFKRRGDASQSTTFATILFLTLIVSAFTAEVIGIHAFFGAFLGGAIAPKDGRLEHILAPKIELMTREVLLPLFFAASGIKTNIGSLNTARYWGMTLFIILVATVGKMLPGTLSTRYMTGQPWRFSFGIGILMNTRGLVELIALNVARDLGILGEVLFTMMVVMALVTTAMTGPLFYLIWIRHRQPGDPVDKPTRHNDESFLTPAIANAQLQDELALEKANLDAHNVIIPMYAALTNAPDETTPDGTSDSPSNTPPPVEIQV